MCRSDFIFNNKILRFSFIFFIAIAIYFILPSNAYAVEIQNPKMEIYGLKDPQIGVAQNYDDLLAGTNGDTCISNPYGVPKYVYVYLPKNTISSYYQYTLKHSFSWRTSLGFDTWPLPPAFQFSNGTAIQYTQNDWKNVYNGTTSEQVVRDNFFVSTFEAPYVNLLTDEVVLVYNFTDYSSNPGKTPFYLEFCSWGINLNTTGVNGDPDNSNLGIVIDNSKNDIIANQNNIFNESKENFKEMISDDVSSGNSKFDNFIKNFKLNDNGGISQIVTMPINLVRNILTDNKCHDLHIDDLLGTSVDFPNGCAFWNSVPNDKVLLYRMLICGLFSYVVITNIFHDIHKLKNPHDLGVDTLDL